MIPRVATTLLALLLLLLTSTALSAPTPKANPDPTPRLEPSLLHHRAIDIPTVAHDLLASRPVMPTDETADIYQAPVPDPSQYIVMQAETALSQKVEVKLKKRHFFRAVERDIWDGEGLLRRGFWGVREVE